MGTAMSAMTNVTDIQLPIPFDPIDCYRRPYLVINFSFNFKLSMFVKKEKMGANGNATAKKLMKPI